MTLPNIFPLAPGAITVDFGNEISVALNDRAIALASWFELNPFDGFIEAAPAFSSVAIFYDLATVRRAYPNAATGFEAVRSIVESNLKRVTKPEHERARLVEIPVDFSPSAALDLGHLADENHLSIDDFIHIFVSRAYRVFMLGFLPGFAYMGEVDDRIAVPRKRTPRKIVPRGSVGIAGRQTGVYPLDSPGGWQVVGRTDLEMFTPKGDRLTLLRPGDEVRFVAQ